jgi:hypothetical protein
MLGWVSNRPSGPEPLKCYRRALQTYATIYRRRRVFKASVFLSLL